ncbi:MAG TPA: glycosyltransferase family 87 protein [Devosiaceae bacterium]|nr:glycosyltransferase family 87 protein [Devosiaceae bacterium]
MLDLACLAVSLGRNVGTWPGLGAALVTNTIGGDFINMWSAAKLAALGRLSEIYRPDAFMAFEHGTIPYDIGLRLWAYPPTSLPLIWPLASLDFVIAYVIWSLLGLLVLAVGARRFGFGWLETAVIVLSPAAFSCIQNGQTGNVAAGLLLLALSGRRDGEKLPVLGAALLSIKPQIALLLPVLWLVRRWWRSLLWTVMAVLALIAASVALYGFAPWASYVADSLSVLDELERRGTGPFMDMIPSLFMSLRVLGLPDGPAFLWHLAFAAPVFVFCCWRLLVSREWEAQAAIVLAGAALITPYLHIYDLAPLVAAGLLVLRRSADAGQAARLFAILVVMANAAMPILTFALNVEGVPVSPLLILPLLLMASFAPPKARAVEPAVA